ncbi:MAG: quaternary ammonium compound efflux SMR transporter SugE [Myxococcota bacterium]
MSWILLVLAGLLETGWAIGLKYTEGFSKPVPTVLTVVAMVASMGLLGLALRDLPVGTAYAVWVGIGAFGTAVLGILLFGEPATPARLFFLVLLAVAIAGLKVTSPST